MAIILYLGVVKGKIKCCLGYACGRLKVVQSYFTSHTTQNCNYLMISQTLARYKGLLKHSIFFLLQIYFYSTLSNDMFSHAKIFLHLCIKWGLSKAWAIMYKKAKWVSWTEHLHDSTTGYYPLANLTMLTGGKVWNTMDFYYPQQGLTAAVHFLHQHLYSRLLS